MLKRFLQRNLETRIGRALIAGDVVVGSTIVVGLEGGELKVEIRQPEILPAEDVDSSADDEAIEAELVDA